MARGPSLLAAVAGLLVGAYFLGIFSERGYWFPLPQLHDGKVALFPPEVVERPIESIFFPIRRQTHALQTPGGRRGGGLAALGDKVLILAGGGSIHSFEEGRIRATGIHAPDTGNEAYLSVPKEHLQEENRDLRYHGLAHYRDDNRDYLLVSFTEWLVERACYGTTVSRLAITSPRDGAGVVAPRGEWEVVYRTQPCLSLSSELTPIAAHGAGSRIAMKAPGVVLLTVGDYGDWAFHHEEKEPLSHDPSSDYGKTLEIDIDRGTSRVVSMGHRNAQGIVVDSEGRIWITEHGPRGGDELNLIVDGENYGWPKQLLGTSYGKVPYRASSSYGRHDGFRAPLHAWLPSIGVSNLAQVAGFHPAWDGDFLIGSLREKSLHRVRIREDRVLFVEPIRIGERIRDVLQHPGGVIYLWTDRHNLISLEPAAMSYNGDRLGKVIGRLGYEPAFSARVERTLAGCQECHSLDASVEGVAPSLAGVFGRSIGGTGFAGYSEAMARHGGRWGRAELSSFLLDTNKFMPGTSMPNPAIGDPKLREAVVDVLDGL